MFPMLLVKSSISVFSLQLFTFGYIDFELLMNDPYPKKTELLCLMDEHN